jgi:battenin
MKLPNYFVFQLYIFVQILNALLFFFNARYFFIPHIGIVLALILIEGLLGGAAYVNTFYQIHQKVGDISKSFSHFSPHFQLAAGENREFSIAVASFADTAGIVLSGFAAIPIHNYICQQALPNMYN